MKNERLTKKVEWEASFKREKKGNLSICRRQGESVEDVFVETAWGKVVFHGTDERQQEYVWYFHPRSGLDWDGVAISSMQFQQKPFQCITIFQGDQEFGLKDIASFSFYAKMDLGALSVSYSPLFAKEARPLIISFEGHGKKLPYVHHMAIAWLYEIIKKTQSSAQD